MRKFILTIAVVIAAASFVSNNGVQAASAPMESGMAMDSINTDSLRAKGARLGQRIVKGATLAADSINSKSRQIGKKAKPVADTIADRSKRVWNAATGKDVKEKK